MQKTLLLALGLLAATPSLIAQREVVGLTNATPYLLSQVMDGRNCAAKRCVVTPHQSQVAAYAGGTAFDGRMNATWVSNGTRLDTVLTPGGSIACRKVCATQAVPQVVNVTKYTTGMAYLESGRPTATGGNGPYGRLYFSYNVPVIGWADVKGCTLFNYKYCRLSFIPSTSRIGGLALDDIKRLLYIGTYDSSGATIVYVTRADSPCTVLCKVQITVDRTVCSTTTPLRGMGGLAYDACAGVIYVTDGRQTVFGPLTLTATGGCRWTHKGCCKTPIELYTGLALLPPAQGTLGRSCTSGRCYSCPTMAATTTGAAVMGNPLFRVNLTNAPSNTGLAVLALGFGGCTSPGLNFGFCNNLLVNMSAPGPLVFFFPTPPSAGSCGTNLSVPLSIPVNQGLCHQKISFQWVVACTPNGGTGVTNCRDFTITAN